jgi:SAM-dependent methyltransferase
MSTYRNTLEAYLKDLHIKAGNVLDIGGGANPAKDRLGSIEYYRYTIADNGLEKTNEVYIQLDLNEGIKDKNFTTFDVIFCLEVLEYVYRPLLALNTIKYLLSMGGVAYITFPSIYPLHNPEGYDYLRYTHEGFEMLLELCGLDVLERVSRMPTDEGIQHLKDFYRSEGLHARKNTPEIFSMGYIYKVGLK